MSTTTPGRRTDTSRPTEQRRYSPMAVGMTVFAGALMVTVGILQALQGLVALINDEFLVVGPDYVYKFDLTTWGWIHLTMGVVVLLAGVFLFRASTWARVIAVMVASVSIIANFMWAPYYPLWSLIVIAMDVFIIWAVTAHGRDILDQSPPPPTR